MGRAVRASRPSGGGGAAAGGAPLAKVLGQFGDDHVALVQLRQQPQRQLARGVAGQLRRPGSTRASAAARASARKRPASRISTAGEREVASAAARARGPRTSSVSHDGSSWRPRPLQPAAKATGRRCAGRRSLSSCDTHAEAAPRPREPRAPAAPYLLLRQDGVQVVVAHRSARAARRGRPSRCKHRLRAFRAPGALPQPPPGAARRGGTRPARRTWHGLGRGAKEGKSATFRAPACAGGARLTAPPFPAPWRRCRPPWPPRRRR